MNKTHIFATLLTLLFSSVSYGQDLLKINILGVRGDVKKNIEAQLTAEEKERLATINSNTIKAFRQRAAQIIGDATAPFGYFTPTIRSDVHHQQQSTWVLDFYVKLNRPTRINSIRIQLTGSGKNNKAITDTLAHLPIQNRQIFTAASYNTAKEKLLDTANNQGYIKARYIENIAEVNTKTKLVNIKWRLETNREFYFGRFSFNKSPYAPSFLERFNTFSSHEKFSSEKLIAWQQALSKSRYFSQATVTPDLEHIDNKHVPIKVETNAPKARLYTLGIGYGTFTGPRLSGGMSFRRLTDTGQSLNVLLKLSSVFNGLALKYSIPGKNPLNEEWLIGANYQKFSPKNGESYAGTVSFGYDKKFESWRLNPSLNYLTERYIIYNNPTRSSQLLYPKLDIAYTKVDDPINPVSGKFLSISLQGASEQFFSRTQFLQSEVKGLLFMTPISFAHILMRADLGYTVAHDLKDLPLTMRFFAGGATSLRGYPDSSIGPGRYLGTGSLEYRNHIYGNWVGAVFYDIGTATNHLGTPLNQGKGVGIIYESIIGPIKLYAARAISKKGQPYQIEFSIGPEF